MEAGTLSRQDHAVSEVLGVVMLLAMVVSMMGGTFMFLTPFVAEFQDNSSWSNANGMAERLDGRLELVGSASEGTGIKTTIPAATSSLSTLINVETWTLSADLTSDERIEVQYLNGSAFSILAYNESAASVSIWTPTGTQITNFTPSHNKVIIEHDLNVYNLYIVSVFDANGLKLHTHAKIVISGLRIVTDYQGGQNEIAVINDARYDRTDSIHWDVIEKPDLDIDELIDGTMRASLRLRDVRIVGAAPSGRVVELDLMSNGPITLFSGDAWHFRFTFDSTLDDAISPQLTQSWLTDYNLNLASGTNSEYRGLSPWHRASGGDGFTIDGGKSKIDLEIDLHRIEVRT